MIFGVSFYDVTMSLWQTPWRKCRLFIRVCDTNLYDRGHFHIVFYYYWHFVVVTSQRLRRPFALHIESSRDYHRANRYHCISSPCLIPFSWWYSPFHFMLHSLRQIARIHLFHKILWIRTNHNFWKSKYEGTWSSLLFVARALFAHAAIYLLCIRDGINFHGIRSAAASPKFFISSATASTADNAH